MWGLTVQALEWSRPELQSFVLAFTWASYEISAPVSSSAEGVRTVCSSECTGADWMKWCRESPWHSHQYSAAGHYMALITTLLVLKGPSPVPIPVLSTMLQPNFFTLSTMNFVGFPLGESSIVWLSPPSVGCLVYFQYSLLFKSHTMCSTSTERKMELEIFFELKIVLNKFVEKEKCLNIPKYY